jgi:hypothetical protein
MVLTCVVCRSQAFDETDEGFFVCLRCGTQSQDVVREVEDEELAFNHAGGGVRGVRSRRAPRPRDDPGAPPPPGGGGVGPPRARPAGARAPASPPGAILDRVVAHCEALQRLLHAQCLALASTFGCPPDTADVAGRYWAAYVDATGLLDLDYDDADTYVVAHASPRGKKTNPRGERERARPRDEDDRDDRDDPNDDDSIDDPNDSSSSSSDDSSSSSSFRRRTLRQIVTAHLPPRVTLSVAYLAALWTRAPIHPGDVSRWAADGDLPYLAASSRVASRLARRLPFPDALAAKSAPRAHLVASGAAHVARMTRATMGAPPPANAAALASRFCAELRLGDDVAARAHRALSVYAPPGLRLHLGDDRRGAYGAPAPPHVHAMAIVVATLKLTYGLDGRGRETVSRRGGETNRRGGTAERRVPPASGNRLPPASGNRGASPPLSSPLPPWRGDWVGWANAVARDVARLAAPRHGDAFVVDAAPKAATDPVAADAFFEFCREHALADVVAAEPLDKFADAMWTAYRKTVGRQTDRGHGDGHGDGDGHGHGHGHGHGNGYGYGYGDGDGTAGAETWSTPGFLARSSLVERARVPSGATGGACVASERRLADAHPEYRAVVEACATLAWASPDALHECVRDLDAVFARFERRLRREAKTNKRRRVDRETDPRG